MVRFIVTAQSYTTTDRIAKTVMAMNEAQVTRLVTAELDAHGYYIVSITR